MSLYLKAARSFFFKALLRFFAVILPFSTAFATPYLTTEKTLNVGDTDLTIQVFSPVSSSSYPLARLIWFPSQYGVLAQEKQVAKKLATLGVESWFVDLFEPQFLAPTVSALDAIPETWTQKIIDHAMMDPKTGKGKNVPTWMVAGNKGAQTAIRGVFSWQQSSMLHRQPLGLILLNPNLLIKTPRPGEVASYWPQTPTMNLPITIIQSALSPMRWHLPSLVSSLNRSGSDVFVQVLPEVRDRYYFRPDASRTEQARATQLAAHLVQAMVLQQPLLQRHRPFIHHAEIDPVHVKAKPSAELTPYLGQQSLGLTLFDVSASGNADTDRVPVDLKNYKNRVVLVNFWASWCPPCVKEMASMVRLQKQFSSQPFDILAVNLGESEEVIRAFLIEHKLNFTVLADEQGQAVQDWKVFAYPSSYLIDKDGRIRYGLTGATEWDDAHHVKKINTLLQE